MKAFRFFACCVFTVFTSCILLPLDVSAAALTWSQATNAPNVPWYYVASSADGSKLAGATSSGGIYTSADGGTTWVSNNIAPKSWRGIASSANGNNLAATVNGGGIYFSIDSGGTWQQAGAPSQTWGRIACTPDGTKMVTQGLGATGQRIYRSDNYGITWSQTASASRYWYSVATSTDGLKLAAVVWNVNAMYTSPDAGAT